MWALGVSAIEMAEVNMSPHETCSTIFLILLKNALLLMLLQFILNLKVSL